MPALIGIHRLNPPYQSTENESAIAPQPKRQPSRFQFAKKSETATAASTNVVKRTRCQKRQWGRDHTGTAATTSAIVNTTNTIGITSASLSDVGIAPPNSDMLTTTTTPIAMSVRKYQIAVASERRMIRFASGGIGLICLRR